MVNNEFNATVSTLFQGMDSFLTTKTVVGEPTKIGDTIILPLVDVSFGVAAGAFGEEKKNSGGGGLGGKMSPSAVLVIQNGTTRLVNIKNQEGITKLLDMLPELMDKVAELKNKKKSPEQAEHDAQVAEAIEAMGE